MSNNLNVAPGSDVSDISQFESVLVIVKQDNQLVGFWAPIDWVNYGANRATLKIVNATDLADVDIRGVDPLHSSNVDQGQIYPAGPDSQDRILISRPPLDPDEAINLIATLYEKYLIFPRTLANLQILDRLSSNVVNDYTQILVPFYGYLNAVTLTWLSKTKPVKLNKYDTAYVMTGETNMLNLIKAQFNQLSQQVTGPLPVDEAKIEITLEMLRILNRGLVPQSVIDQFINQVLSSAELCSLIVLMNQFPKELKIESDSVEAALFNLSKEEMRIILTTNDPVEGDEIFILQYDDPQRLNVLYNSADHIAAINYYLGFPIDALDLSHSYLTGSIVPATSCIYNKRYKFDRIIDALYPPVYTAESDFISNYRQVANRGLENRFPRFTIDVDHHQVGYNNMYDSQVQ